MRWFFGVLAGFSERPPQSATMTANTDLKIIRAIFRSARREGYLFQDPTEGIETVKNRAVFERRPFSIDELRAVLAVAGPEWQSLIKFGLYTGQRLADLATLTWSQIDLERDEIRLTTRKTGKQLLIPIAAPLREHLSTLASGDNPRSPVHPRAFEIIAAQNWKSGNALQSVQRTACRLRIARTSASPEPGHWTRGQTHRNRLELSQFAPHGHFVAQGCRCAGCRRYGPGGS
jgi:integrase